MYQLNLYFNLVKDKTNFSRERERETRIQAVNLILIEQFNCSIISDPDNAQSTFCQRWLTPTRKGVQDVTVINFCSLLEKKGIV